MTIKINNKNSFLKTSPANLVLFVDKKFNISSLKKHISNAEFLYISDLLKNNNKKKTYFFLKSIQKKLYI